MVFSSWRLSTEAVQFIHPGAMAEVSCRYGSSLSIADLPYMQAYMQAEQTSVVLGTCQQVGKARAHHMDVQGSWVRHQPLNEKKFQARERDLEMLSQDTPLRGFVSAL